MQYDHSVIIIKKETQAYVFIILSLEILLTGLEQFCISSPHILIFGKELKSKNAIQYPVHLYTIIYIFF